MSRPLLSDLKICIKGAGEMASGIACRLYQANFRRIVMLETAAPLAVRRNVSFCEAIYHNEQVVEGISAVLTKNKNDIENAWSEKQLAVQVDPQWELLSQIKFDVVIDAILAKRNLGTQKSDGHLVLGLGPGFTADKDVHLVIETQRGHNLGRVIKQGSAEDNTGVPGSIDGYTTERVLRAPATGVFEAEVELGTMVNSGDPIATISGQPVQTQIKGIVRGLIRNGSEVREGLKIGDIDPRGDMNLCHSVSEKARAIGGAVLEAVLMEYNS